MNYYFAPLEGIGGYIYRNAQAASFEKADKYFSPFLSPGIKKRLTRREYKDVAPQNNQGIYLVPQILTNSAEAFLQTVEELQDVGYEEINLNLGCPSRTVVTKGRGAGFLGRVEELERFLDEIFENTTAQLSVKTRIGMSDSAEFQQLMRLFNQYPMKELIIHPRLQIDYYKNHPHMDVFAEALTMAKMPIVYNGDLFTPKQTEQFTKAFPTVQTVMLGRGVLANPALFGEVKQLLEDEKYQDGKYSIGKDATGIHQVGEHSTGKDATGTHQAGEHSTGKDATGNYPASDSQMTPTCLTKENLVAFHDRILMEYEQVLFGEKTILYKMKELWFYMSYVFTDSEKYLKAIRKAQRLSDYNEAVRRLLSEQEIDTNPPREWNMFG